MTERETYHEFLMPECDMRLIIRALEGKDPRDEAEEEGRRIVRNGLQFMLSEEGVTA